MTTIDGNHSVPSERLPMLQAEIAALSSADRAGLLQHALVDLQGLPPICGVIVTPTQLETDLRTIVSRATITTTLLMSQGALNTGDTFQVKATLRNCSGFRLADAHLVASGSAFASVTGTSDVDLGALSNGASASATFSCKATAVTAPSTETLISVSGRCVLDLTTATGLTHVTGEVFPI